MDFFNSVKVVILKGYFEQYTFKYSQIFKQFFIRQNVEN